MRYIFPCVLALALLLCLLMPQSSRAGACNDGIDNDLDGLTDYPNDPDCTSDTDTAELKPIASGSYDTPGTSHGVFVKGRYAYVADHNFGLRIVYIANPLSPSIISTNYFDTSDNAYSVYVNDNYAYVADGADGLQIIDVTDPKAPVLKGSLDTPGTASDVYVDSNYAYIADGFYGIQIINISDPASPVLTGSYNTFGIASSVYINEGYAYVADGSYGLQIINVSNPSSPTLAGTYNTPGTAYDVYVRGSIAYVADGSYGLQIINVTNPASPSLLGSYDTPGSAGAVYVSGNLAYVADGISSVQIINIYNPGAMLLAGSYVASSYYADIYVIGNYAYIARGTYGLLILKINATDSDSDGLANYMEYYLGTNPADPDSDDDGMQDGWEGLYIQCMNPLAGDSQENPDGDAYTNLEEYNLGGNPCLLSLCSDGLDNDDDTYIDYPTDSGCSDMDDNNERGTSVCDDGIDNDADGLTDYPFDPDCSGPTDTSELNIVLKSNISVSGFYGAWTWNAYVKGNYAYYNFDYDGGIRIYNVSNPSTPYEVGRFESPTVNAVYVSGNYAYLADIYEGLKILDISDPANPTLVGSFFTPFGVDVKVRDNYAYFVDADMGLWIFDISIPSAPYPVGQYTNYGLSAIVIKDDYAYMVWGDYLYIVDISTPSNPSFVSSYFHWTYDIWNLDMQGNYVYLGNQVNPMAIIDVSNPYSPNWVAWASFPSFYINAQDVHVIGNYAYSVDQPQDFDISNISNPASPVYAGGTGTTDVVFGLYVLGRYAYIADRTMIKIYEVAGTDSDSDGIPNHWELFYGCLDAFTADGGLDSDSDSLSNLDEFKINANPCNPDTDGDGMPDGWEQTYSSCMDTITANANLDPDNDGLINIAEYNLGTNPCEQDTDGDGMDDGWEFTFMPCVEPLFADSVAVDPDGDGLLNIDEFHNGTDPCSADTDSDGVSDFIEAVEVACLNPLDPDSDHDGLGDGSSTGEDVNSNGIVDPGETNPCNADSDGGGEWDGSEIGASHDPLNPADDAVAPKNWTIMVYMDGDNNLESSALADINEMEQIGSNENINVIVLLDRIDGYDNTNGDWTGARYYYITQDSDPLAVHSVFLKDLGEKNMGDPKTLEDFITWGVSHFPASNYALIIWDHGSGWKRVKTMPFKGVAFDDTSGGDHLTNTDLESALSSALTDTELSSINLLGFDACLMQMTEVAYSMQNYIDYMVGSEENIPEWGWPYHRWLAGLAADPNMTAQELGLSIVQSYYDWHISNSTLSLVDLAQMDNLALSLDAFATQLIAARCDYSANLLDAFEQSRKFGDPDYVDLYHYASLIAALPLPYNLIHEADNVMNALSSAVIFNRSHLSNANGLSIYFPSYYNYMSSYESLGLAADTSWDEFISGFQICDEPDSIIFCGDQISDDNITGENRLNFYNGAGWDESGYERIYAVTVADGSSLKATISNFYYVDQDLDVFILGGSSQGACTGNCLAYGDKTATVSSVSAGTYYIVVDGYDGGYNYYDLAVTCQGASGDYDQDGLNDDEELNVYGTDPLDPDSDDDGLNDGDEVLTYGTNPLVADTDGGGENDGSEIASGHDPLNPADDCIDHDGDGHGDNNCAAGSDCNDNNPYSWDTCATCNDDDSDTYYELCNVYSAGDSVTMIVGGGTYSWYYPLFTYYGNTRTQVIYLASEIGQPGTITALALDVTTIPGATMNNFTIRMKPTTLSSYSTNAWEGPNSGWTTIYQSNEPPGATGWHTFILSTPFYYNGMDNLMVDFTFSSSTNIEGNCYSTNTGVNRSLVYNTSSYGDPLTWSGTSSPTPSASTYIPNIKFIAKINGPDCDDTNAAHWDDCSLCVDNDGDGRGTDCNLGTDCDDSNSYTWDTCASCKDNDADTWFELCNRYTPPIGTGTSPWEYPLNNYYGVSRTQVIYLASDIGSAGTINSLALDVTTIPGAVMNNFTIRMKHTTLNSYGTNSWEGPSSGWTTVYQNNEPRGSTGWRTFVLTTPFSYNGTDNLMVDFSINDSSPAYQFGYCLSTETGVNRSLVYYNNSYYGDPLTWSGTSNPTPTASTYIPNIRMTINGVTVFGPDCDDNNPNTWDTCATCLDPDGDGWYQFCNQYQTVNGPDCDEDAVTGLACHDGCGNFYQDSDSDGYGKPSSSVNRCVAPAGYVANNTDCSDTNTNAWNTCSTCVDTDADGWYQQCNRYLTVDGPDCDNNAATGASCHDTCTNFYQDNDSDAHGNPGVSLSRCTAPTGYVPDNTDCLDTNPSTWDTCATCNDYDGDSYYELCNAYYGINGPDCDDTNFNTWDTCATCHDNDSDTWYELCNSYLNLVTIGAGTGTWYYPLETYYADARTQTIYLASEIGSAGQITAVALDVTTIPGAVMNNFTLRMKHTTMNLYSTPYSWDGSTSGWSTVYQNNEPRGATGWRTFVLTTPFDYNGTENLMVDFSFNNSSSPYSRGYVHYSNTGMSRSLVYNTTSSGDPLNWTGTSNPTPTASAYIPNLRMTISSPTINGPDCDDNDPNHWDDCSVDTDGDGLSDLDEINLYGTDPHDADTDKDGLEDGFEVVTSLTLPAYWDTDGDGLPDGYEHFDANLDPGSSVDGGLDFDGDGNPNAHEYYNGTDMNDPDPTGHFEVEAGNLGCAYWGDADGVCIITSPDLSMLRNAVARAPVYYGEVIPDNGQTQDLDRDDNIGAPDISWMRNFVARAPVGGIPSRSDRLVILEMPGDTLNPAEIEVGSTCEIKLGVLAEHSSHEKYVPGFAVHFSIDPASTGDATIFGGDGDRDGVRYDISGDYTEFSPARVVLRIDEAGTIILNAEIPACGQLGTGRSAEQVVLETPVVIIGK